jgi:hypothetical protein
MYPATWFLTFVVAPSVSASTACLLSSKLLENLSGKRDMSSWPNRFMCSVLTFPKCAASSDYDYVLPFRLPPLESLKQSSIEEEA